MWRDFSLPFCQSLSWFVEKLSSFIFYVLCAVSFMSFSRVINSQACPINLIDPEIPYSPLIVVSFLLLFITSPKKMFHFLKILRGNIGMGSKGLRRFSQCLLVSENSHHFNTYLNYVMHAPAVGCTYWNFRYCYSSLSVQY